MNTTESHGHHVSDGGQEAKLANHVLPYSKNTENIVTFDLRNRNFSLACDTGAFSGEVSDNVIQPLDFSAFPFFLLFKML